MSQAPRPQEGVSAQIELQARPQWVCWRYEKRRDTLGNEKRTKVPYNPKTGRPARSNDPTTWASYQEARTAWKDAPKRYQGIGYMLSDDYIGIDLDHCVKPDGSLETWAQTLLDQLASYAEYSPGDGVHILIRNALPEHMRHTYPIAETSHPAAKVELYSKGRYFTMTGRHVVGTPETIEARLPALQAWCRASQVSALRRANSSQEQTMATASASRLSAPTLDDRTLLERAMQARNGSAFRALWEGNTSGYNSPSEADQALCSHLAFWTGSDPARVDRLFRQSGLYRSEKWDRPARTGETYGQGTITRACQSAATSRCGTTRAPGVILPFPDRTGQPPGGEENLFPQMEDLPKVDLAFVQECLRREEEGDARLYAHLFKGRCIYDHTERLWYEWQGHFWKRDEKKHSLVLVSNPLAAVYLEASALLSEQAAEQARQLDPDQHDAETNRQKERLAWLKKETAALIERARKLKTLKRMEHVLTIAQALLPIISKAWDCNPWLLACANGVLDLRTGKLHPGRPEDNIRSAIPTEWLGLETPARRFEQFLQEVFDDRSENDRAEVIAFAQRMLGYGITGDVSEHIFLVLYGEEGRNGKDTLQHAISHTLGEISSAISKDVLLEAGRMRTAGSATPHICDLQGKRLAWASEPEKGARFSVSQVKEYSGGGEIPSRGMYERAISKIKPTHLLILLTNHKPYADADDKAFWDRLRLITFNLRYVDNPADINERKKDTTLWQALEAEASGILAWLVRGCLEWQRCGLDTPPAILADGEQYRREQDALDLFLSACCVLDKQACAGASALYEAYVAWGKSNNLRNLMTGTSFGKKLTKRFAKKRTTKGLTYQGIRLLNAEKNPTLFDPAEISTDVRYAGKMYGSPTNRTYLSSSLQKPMEDTPSQRRM